MDYITSSDYLLYKFTVRQAKSEVGAIEGKKGSERERAEVWDSLLPCSRTRDARRGCLRVLRHRQDNN